MPTILRDGDVDDLHCDFVNSHGGKSNIAIPEGYYGNAFAFPVTIKTVGDLAAKLLSTAVDLEMKRRRGIYFHGPNHLMRSSLAQQSALRCTTPDLGFNAGAITVGIRTTNSDVSSLPVKTQN
jgi:hypothetical protein